MSSPLPDRDRLLVLETLQEIRSAPPPRSLAGLGCVMALPSFFLVLVFPVVGRRLDVSSALATTVLVIGGALLVVGLLLWFTAGGFVRGHTIAAAEAALRTLEAGDEDRDVLLRAATLLLCNAYATYGPSTAEAFDFEAARARLGPRLELVLAVEGILLKEGATYPVFTLESGAEPGGT
ncbi:MAG: hypothetical protein Q8N53_07680 [Longimicrobiales bacterium]|nr:hypothetical protein [Longimicrobiales bacterium]